MEELVLEKEHVDTFDKWCCLQYVQPCARRGDGALSSRGRLAMTSLNINLTDVTIRKPTTVYEKDDGALGQVTPVTVLTLEVENMAVVQVMELARYAANQLLVSVRFESPQLQMLVTEDHRDRGETVTLSGGGQSVTVTPEQLRRAADEAKARAATP